MKIHLVPEMIVDLGNKATDRSIVQHIRDNYIMRLEAIRDYCNSVLEKNNNNVSDYRRKK